MELTKEQLDSLRDLLTHDGWGVYNELYDEVMRAALKGLENADDFDEFLQTQAQVKLLRRLQHLVQENLEEEENERMD